MSTKVIHKETLEERLYVNTPDYPSEEWLHDPVEPECEKKFWKVVGDALEEMSQPEKDAVLSAEAISAAVELERSKLAAFREWGTNLVLGLRVQMRLGGLDRAGAAALYPVIMQVVVALELGHLEAASSMIPSVTEIGPLTPQLKSAVKAQIDSYLSSWGI